VIAFEYVAVMESGPPLMFFAYNVSALHPDPQVVCGDATWKVLPALSASFIGEVLSQTAKTTMRSLAPVTCWNGRVLTVPLRTTRALPCTKVGVAIVCALPDTALTPRNPIAIAATKRISMARSRRGFSRFEDFLERKPATKVFPFEGVDACLAAPACGLVR
jgi:hypothetical protein